MTLRRTFCPALLLSLLTVVAAAAQSTHAQIHSTAPEAHRNASADTRRNAPPFARRSRQTDARPLWPGARFTEADRARAVMRGLRFIYRTALEPANFDAYGGDYLWCFYTLSTAVADPSFQLTARRMGVERARVWRRQHRRLPRDADAATVSAYVFGSDAADSLGLRDARLQRELKRAAPRFTAREFLQFDPRYESPPADVPAECKFDDATNPRGATVCRVCRRPLTLRTRYDVWYDALITAYVGERYGVVLGARYRDVLRWLPTLRPYPDAARGDEFFDAVYAVTHVVYTLNDYNQRRLAPQLLPAEYAFLQAHLRAAIAAREMDMLGEMMDSLRAFGVTETDADLRAAVEFYLAHQNRDGSWGDPNEPDIYDRYHPTWNAVAGLSRYRWRAVGPRRPELAPLLDNPVAARP
jgi:hypothetical protein